MISFSIKPPDMNSFKELSDEKLKKVLMKSMFKMEEVAINAAPSNDGELRNKITLFPQILSDRYVLTSNAPYSAAMEYGTRPFYAPIAPLKKWAVKKLGDEDAAYAVRAKIAKFGVKAHPFMRPSLFQVKSYWIFVFANQENNK